MAKRGDARPDPHALVQVAILGEAADQLPHLNPIPPPLIPASRGLWEHHREESEE